MTPEQLGILVATGKLDRQRILAAARLGDRASCKYIKMKRPKLARIYEDRMVEILSKTLGYEYSAAKVMVALPILRKIFYLAMDQLESALPEAEAKGCVHLVKLLNDWAEQPSKSLRDQVQDQVIELQRLWRDRDEEDDIYGYDDQLDGLTPESSDEVEANPEDEDDLEERARRDELENTVRHALIDAAKLVFDERDLPFGVRSVLDTISWLRSKLAGDGIFLGTRSMNYATREALIEELLRTS